MPDIKIWAREKNCLHQLPMSRQVLKPDYRTVTGTTTPAPMFVSRLRTDEEKAALRPICDACESQRGGQCHAAKCCGSKLPVETILNLNTTHCPKGKF